MRKPPCHQGNQLDGELWPGAMLRIGFAFGGLVLLFPLGEALAVAIEPESDRQGKELCWEPRKDEQSVDKGRPSRAPN